MSRKCALWMYESGLADRARAEADRLAKKARGARMFAVAGVQPAGGATVDVDGRRYSAVPASVRSPRGVYGERELARATKRNQDDAWLVIAPDRESVLGLIVGVGRQWSIYRRADDASSPRVWRSGDEAEVMYRRGFDGDWRSAVSGLAKMEL